MKFFLYLAAIVVFPNVGIFGQDATPTPSDATALVAKPQADLFVREKFDPARDPKADLKAAIETASKSGKRIILDLGGEWCGWCVYMDKFFFKNPALAKLRDDNFVWVKVNVDEKNQNKAFLKAYPEASGYPHLYVLSRTGKLLRSQDTSPLEKGEGYNLVKFTRFLKSWSPKKMSSGL